MSILSYPISNVVDAQGHCINFSVLSPGISIVSACTNVNVAAKRFPALSLHVYYLVHFSGFHLSHCCLLFGSIFFSYTNPVGAVVFLLAYRWSGLPPQSVSHISFGSLSIPCWAMSDYAGS